jgi:hypothetical protein
MIAYTALAVALWILVPPLLPIVSKMRGLIHIQAGVLIAAFIAHATSLPATDSNHLSTDEGMIVAGLSFLFYWLCSQDYTG